MILLINNYIQLAGFGIPAILVETFKGPWGNKA
jgi:hypothetical protein